MIAPYTAVAVQTIIRQVKETAWRDTVIRENVNRGLAGEVSGTFEDHAIHFFGFSVNWML